MRILLNLIKETLAAANAMYSEWKVKSRVISVEKSMLVEHDDKIYLKEGLNNQ